MQWLQQSCASRQSIWSMVMFLVFCFCSWASYQSSTDSDSALRRDNAIVYLPRGFSFMNPMSWETACHYDCIPPSAILNWWYACSFSSTTSAAKRDHWAFVPRSACISTTAPFHIWRPSAVFSVSRGSTLWSFSVEHSNLEANYVQVPCVSYCARTRQHRASLAPQLSSQASQARAAKLWSHQCAVPYHHSCSYSL